LARMFYMSTVANTDTHMFEAKAEILGYRPAVISPLGHYLLGLSEARIRDLQAGLFLAAALANSPVPALTAHFAKKPPDPGTSLFRPGMPAKLYFNLRSNPEALIVPEEAVRATERGFVAFVPERRTRDDGQDEYIARSRTLELGFRAEGWIEVKSGLRLGE